MEDIKNKLKAVIGDKNVQIIDSETGKKLSLDELVDKLSKPALDELVDKLYKPGKVISVTGKELSLDELVGKLSTQLSDDFNIETTLVFLKRSAKEVRTCLSKLPMSREISLALTKLDECMLWVKSFEMNNENKKD